MSGPVQPAASDPVASSPAPRNPYRQLLATPGAPAFFVAGLVARYPIAMVTLGIVVMLGHTRHDFELAGLVAGVCILADAVIAPQLSRLADRYGQTRVALPASAVACVAFALLLAAATWRWPDWTLFASAAGVGTMPHFGAFSRARWSHLHGGTPLLRSAFAMEALCEELVWMTGPIIVVVCASHLAPQAGVAAAALIFVVGALAFCAQRGTEPPPHAKAQAAHASPRHRPVIFTPAVLLAALILFAFGGFFGVLEVATTAFAKQLGVSGQTYYPFTAYAVGSLLTGSLYGLRHWQAPLPRQLLWLAAAFALTTLPFFWITGMASLTVICFVAGTACSPTLIIALGLIEHHVAKDRLTESMTWALVSPPVGMSLGFALAGRLVERTGAQATFAAVVPFGIMALGVAAVAALQSKVFFPPSAEPPP